MAKHLRNSVTGEVIRVSKTEAKDLHAMGYWEYIDKDTYARYDPANYPDTGKPEDFMVRNKPEGGTQ